jgi:proline dehydrogenase
MTVMRSVLLAASENRWLRERGTRLPLVRRAVSRFMPGETVGDALAAAETLRHAGMGAVLTKLGENVTDPGEADAVRDHYLGVLDLISRRALDCQISVKLTQLGLDIDLDHCLDRVRALAARAAILGNFLWIDMEQYPYVDRTLEVYRRTRADFFDVGVCLQSYLYRTADDLAALIAMGGAVRLVKGAYREPATVAHPAKRDVDASFRRLAERMINPDARAGGFRSVFGTHDRRLMDAIVAHAAVVGAPPETYEFDLLYGIQRREQERLVRAGQRVRVLVSYGSYWFPWYMRRLAERPANLWFVLKSALPN